jgi:hypothetical protein
MMALTISGCRTGGEAAADAELDVDVFHLEIGDHVQFLVLLLQRQDVTDFSVEGIIFEADKSIVAQIAGEPRRRRKIGFAAWAEADIDNRVDDELPFLGSTTSKATQATGSPD